MCSTSTSIFFLPPFPKTTITTESTITYLVELFRFYILRKGRSGLKKFSPS